MKKPIAGTVSEVCGITTKIINVHDTLRRSDFIGQGIGYTVDLEVTLPDGTISTGTNEYWFDYNELGAQFAFIR